MGISEPNNTFICSSKDTPILSFNSPARDLSEAEGIRGPLAQRNVLWKSLGCRSIIYHLLGITDRNICNVLQKYPTKQLPCLLRRPKMVELCLPDGNMGSIEVCLENSSPHIAHEWEDEDLSKTVRWVTQKEKKEEVERLRKEKGWKKLKGRLLTGMNIWPSAANRSNLVSIVAIIAMSSPRSNSSWCSSSFTTSSSSMWCLMENMIWGISA